MPVRFSPLPTLTLCGDGFSSTGGGGAGWRGGAASTDDLVDGQVRATASGAGGSSGGDAEFASLYRVVNQGLDADRGPAQVFFQIYTIGSPCEHLSDTVETVSTTTTVEQTNFVETVYTPSATVTESPTTTVTATPEAVTETEYPETTTITLCVAVPSSLSFLSPLNIAHFSSLLPQSCRDFHGGDERRRHDSRNVDNLHLDCTPSSLSFLPSYSPPSSSRTSPTPPPLPLSPRLPLPPPRPLT